MSFPDPPPPPFMSLPFIDNNVDGIWPQPATNHEHPDSQSQFEHAPLFKRPRNFESNQPNSSPFPPMNLMLNPFRTSHIFFKTRICAKFLEGNCQNGENCTFAHGAEDLREPPPNWKALVHEKDKAGDWNDDQRIIHRMKICKKFYNGEKCPYGENCNFLHEPPSNFKADGARARESSAISIETRLPIMEHRDNSDQPETNKHMTAILDASGVNTNAVFWKTKLCSKWETMGHCPFGERCHFAHGPSDLQVPRGCVEAEVMLNNSPIPTKPLSVPANNASAADTVIGSHAKEGEVKKGLSKWKGNKKINLIYGDWIDDLTPPHSLPRELKS